MKRKISIASLLGSLLLCLSLCGASVLPKDKRFVDYFLHLHAADLFRTQSFILKNSTSYISQERLEKVSMSFSCYRVLSLNQARILIVTLANQLLEKINADTELRARHLVNEPFTASRLRLEVKTDNLFSANSDVASIRTILLNGTEIIYESFPKSNIYSGSPTVYKETFEYALMQLDDATLLEQPDNPLANAPSTKPWKGKVFPSELAHFGMSVSKPHVVSVSDLSFVSGPSLSQPKQLSVVEQSFASRNTTQSSSLPKEIVPGFFSPEAMREPCVIEQNTLLTSHATRSFYGREGEFVDDLSHPSLAKTVKMDVGASSFPDECSFVAEKWHDKRSSLDREGDLPILVYAPLAPSSFPISEERSVAQVLSQHTEESQTPPEELKSQETSIALAPQVVPEVSSDKPSIDSPLPPVEQKASEETTLQTTEVTSQVKSKTTKRSISKKKKVKKAAVQVEAPQKEESAPKEETLPVETPAPKPVTDDVDTFFYE